MTAPGRACADDASALTSQRLARGSLLGRLARRAPGWYHDTAMGERWDRLRSRVQHAAASVKEGAAGSGLAKLRHAAREIAARRAAIPVRILHRVGIGVPGVAVSSVRIADGAIVLDFELEGGRLVRAALRPETPRFAPRGAKELVFSVTPAEAAAEAAVREYVGALAALVARTLWSATLGPPPGTHESGFTEREGGALRIDVRTIPAVRGAIQKGAAATMMDVIALDGMFVDDDALVLRIGLPPLLG